MMHALHEQRDSVLLRDQLSKLGVWMKKGNRKQCDRYVDPFDKKSGRRLCSKSDATWRVVLVCDGSFTSRPPARV
jgi:hypothetical protein